MFPVGHLQKTEVRRIARGGGPAEPRQEGLDRHLLHRRAAVPRVPQPLPAARRPARWSRRRAGASASTSGSRSTPSGRGRASASAAWRRASRWYVAREAHGGERAGGGAGPRPPAADALLAAGRWMRAGCWMRRRPARRIRPRRAIARPTPPAPWRASQDGGDRGGFAQPQWAVTPGQSVVLYDGEVCLGGAVIE